MSLLFLSGKNGIVSLQFVILEELKPNVGCRWVSTTTVPRHKYYVRSNKR